MSCGILHACPNNFRTYEVLIAAKYGGSDIKVENAQPSSDKAKFGKLPTLDCKEGNQQLTGSHAIAKFVAKEKLYATFKCPAGSAEIVQWCELVDNDLLPNALAWLLPSVSAMQFNKTQVDEAKAETMRLLTTLNDYLLPKTFLVRERTSLADVALACALFPLFQHVIEPETRKKLINLTRWFETCINQPNFKAILGEIQLCTKASQFDAAKFEQFQTKKSTEGKGAKKDEKKEAAKPKEKAPKDKAKAKAAAAAEEEDEADATDEAIAQEPKQNDPFAEMPKGTFNMDEFKRVYSNEDTMTKALPYFWQHFDPEAFSIWYCEYKYANELTLAFMSCNLISGMFQRLDKLRKNAFSSMCLFGTDNNSTISGLWVWRGHGLAFELSDDWKIDYESYSWKKLDAKAPETKKIIQDYFSWEGDFGGKKFNQGKIFK